MPCSMTWPDVQISKSTRLKHSSAKQSQPRVQITTPSMRAHLSGAPIPRAPHTAPNIRSRPGEMKSVWQLNNYSDITQYK